MNELERELAKYGWTSEDVEAAVLSRFRCVLCGISFRDKWDGFIRFKRIQLLPKNKYPDLGQSVSNQAAVCDTCAYLKGNWDPNSENNVKYYGIRELSPKQRRNLLISSMMYVKNQKLKYNKILMSITRLYYKYEDSYGLGDLTIEP